MHFFCVYNNGVLGSLTLIRLTQIRITRKPTRIFELAMALLTWFDTDEVDEFARALARDLIGRLPPLDADKKATPERLRNTHDAILSRASAFARTHKINWYKKAHLGNTLKWELRGAGYDQEFADAMTYDVLVAITPARQKASR